MIELYDLIGTKEWPQDDQRGLEDLELGGVLAIGTGTQDEFKCELNDSFIIFDSFKLNSSIYNNKSIKYSNLTRFSYQTWLNSKTIGLILGQAKPIFDYSRAENN